MKKRIISMVICICVFLLLCSCSQQKSNKNNGKSDVDNGKNVDSELLKETPISDFEYKDGTDGIVITKYKGNDKRVSVPAIIENKKVVGYEKNVFAGNIILEEIVIPEYITFLDFSYFENCDNLKSITCLGDVDTFGDEYPSLNLLEKICLPTSKKGIDPKVLENYSSINTVDIRGVVGLETIKNCFRLCHNDNMSITISEQLFSSIEDYSWVYMLRYGSWEKLSKNDNLNKKGVDICFNIADAFSDQEYIYNSDVIRFYERGNIPNDSLKKIKDKVNDVYRTLNISNDAVLTEQSQWVYEENPFGMGQYGQYVYEGFFEKEYKDKDVVNSRVYVIAGLSKAYFHCFFQDVDQQFCLITNTEKIIVNGKEFSMKNL